MAEPYYGDENDGVGKKRFMEDPDFVPMEVEDEARASGSSPNAPVQRQAIRDMVMMDPDMFGDWDRYQ